MIADDSTLKTKILPRLSTSLSNARGCTSLKTARRGANGDMGWAHTLQVLAAAPQSTHFDFESPTCLTGVHRISCEQST